MGSSSDDESYILEAERKAKQNYLTEEILENNYDPELFMMFCGSRKEANIDAWTFEELQECVHEFKMTYRRGQTLKDVQEAEKPHEVKQKKKDEEEEVEKKPAPRVNAVEKIYEKTENKPAPAIKNPLAEDKPKPVEKVLEKPSVASKVVAPPAKIIKEQSKPEPQSAELPKPSEVSREPKAQSSEFTKADVEEFKSNEIPPDEGKLDSSEPIKDPIPKEDKFTIHCIQAEETELSRASSINFEISEPVLVEGGFFSPNYYVYPVKVSPMSWESRHRFSEFVWLREMVSMLHPGVFVPPIPPRKSRAGTEGDIVKKRRKILMRFTSGLARKKLFMMSPVVEGFFRISDGKEFSAFQKDMKKKLKKPESVEQFITIDGLARCDITFQGQRPEKLGEYANSCETIEKKLKRQAANVMSDIRAVENDFSVLEELTRSLEEVQKMLPYTGKLGQLYGFLASTLKSLSEQEGLRYDLFEEFFNMYFKYTYLEKDTMKELLKERENVLNEYTKAELKHKNLDKYRSLFGFLNVNSLEEIEREVLQQTKLMNKHFIDFSHEKVKITTELHGIWAKLIDSIAGI